MSRCPNQRNSRSGRTVRTVGLNRIPAFPGGAMYTDSRSPCAKFPEMDLMKGFQDDILAKSVRSDQMHTAEAFISMLVSIRRSTIALASFLKARLYIGRLGLAAP